jgi:hypothetical protein
MMEDDAWRFFFAARMRAFGAKTPKELVLMQREYSLRAEFSKSSVPPLCATTGPTG